MYPLILGLTSIDVFPVRNARANTNGSTIGVLDSPCQYLETDFFCEIATVIDSIYARFVSDISGVTIE